MSVKECQNQSSATFQINHDELQQDIQKIQLLYGYTILSSSTTVDEAFSYKFSVLMPVFDDIKELLKDKLTHFKIIIEIKQLEFQTLEPNANHNDKYQDNHKDGQPNIQKVNQEEFIRLYQKIPHPLIFARITVDHDNPIPMPIKNAFNLLFTRLLKSTQGHLYLTLKQFSNQIGDIFQLYLSLNLQVPMQPPSKNMWTQKDQSRLEEALLLHRSVTDILEKWQKIATHVGNNHTVESCKQRYIECRNIVSSTQEKTNLNKVIKRDNSKKLAQKPINHITQSSTKQRTDINTKKLNDDIKALSGSSQPTTKKINKITNLSTETLESIVKSDEISCVGLEFENISIMYVKSGRLVIQCTRCSIQTEEVFRSLFPGTELIETEEYGSQLQVSSKTLQKLTVYKNSCTRCHLAYTVEMKNNPCVANQPVILIYTATDCIISDFVLNLVLIECLYCQAALTCKDITAGRPYTYTCSYCFQHLSLTYTQLSIDQRSPKRDTVKGSIRNVSRASKSKKEEIFTLGKPLPLNGACKHYKKSFRWYRFPCCGRAFPCDECHNEQTGHTADWAKRMICGYCSSEQAISQKPCSCGHSTLAGSSSHWEGGKGCRDQTKMSRKDKRKYRHN